MAIEYYSSIDLNKNELQNAVVQNLGSAPGSPVEGQIYYDTGDDTIYFRNGSAWVSIGGDITGVTAGDGLTGGGTTGAVTLNVVGGDGITANANDVAITAAQTTITSVLNNSLVVGRDATDQIKFSTNNQIIFRVNGGDGVTFKGSGEIEATSLDISGDIDIDGTANLDAVDIDGVANFAAVDHVMTNGANINDDSDNLMIGFATNAVTLGSPTIFDSTLTIASDIIHKDDANNKISFGTDTQSFETGGTARMNISDSGLQIGSGARVTTIQDSDSLGTSDTKLATQGNIKAYVDARTGTNITSLGAIAQDTVTFSSANASDPLINILNTTNDTNAARLRFTKDRGAAGSDGMEVGRIEFYGDDDAQTLTEWARIQANVGDASNSAEGGKLILAVASHDGEMNTGLLLADGNAEDEIDVTIGKGTSSITTIAGLLTVTGNLTVNGTTTTVNSTTTTLDDPIFTLGGDTAPESDDNKDRGIEFRYHDGSAAKIGFFGWDDSATGFTGFSAATNSSEVFSGTVMNATFGVGTFASLDISGNVDVDGTLETDALTVNGTAIATVIAGTTVTNATNAAHVLITDNENTNEENEITFIEGAGGGGANRGLEADGDFTYNPSTGTVSATIFKGNIDAVDGDFDGTLETDALTINGTAIVAQATASAVGGVELATAAEVITGTDTARVVTADTLSAKSVVCDIDVSSLTDANIVTITHNLGTADIVVQVYDKTTEANIMCDIARTTDDFSTASTSVVSIDFGTAPPNDCRALITSLAGATAGSIAYT